MWSVGSWADESALQLSQWGHQLVVTMLIKTYLLNITNKPLYTCYCGYLAHKDSTLAEINKELNITLLRGIEVK